MVLVEYLIISHLSHVHSSHLVFINYLSNSFSLVIKLTFLSIKKDILIKCLALLCQVRITGCYHGTISMCKACQGEVEGPDIGQ